MKPTVLLLSVYAGLSQAIRQGGLSQSMTDALLDYNAIYNGTLTVIMTATDTPSCNLAEGNIPGYALQIGPMVAFDNATINRADYDTNPFYFYIDGPSIASGTFLYLSSSWDNFNSGSTYWNLTATKSGDGFDVTGKHVLYSYHNEFGLNTCNINIINTYIEAKNNWTMSGHISSTTANLTWGPAPWTSGGVDFTRWWTFTGSLDTSLGPKVDVSGSELKVTGLSKYSPKATATSSPTSGSSAAVNTKSFIHVKAGLCLLLSGLVFTFL